jgi:hypothetical protein
MYARFVEVYMPAHKDKNCSNTWTREQVLEEALKTFDKQTEYDAMIKEHKFKVAEEELWKEIRVALPMESKSISLALKGLRRWVVFRNGEPRIASEPDFSDKPTWTKAMSPGSKESLLSWVQGNWEEAKALEKARANAVKAVATME